MPSLSHVPVMPLLYDGNDAKGSAPVVPCMPVDGYQVPPALSQVVCVVFEDRLQTPAVELLQPVVWQAAQL